MPVSNLIEALVVVKNGVPKMKGLFSLSLMSKITKSMGYTCSVVCGQDGNRGASNDSSFSDVLINLAPFSTSFIFSTSITGVSVSVSVGFSTLSSVTFVLLLPPSSPFVREIEFKFFVTGNLASSLINTFSGSASCEFLEKPEHFSHPTIDLLVLLENGVLKSFHPFGVVISITMPEFYGPSQWKELSKESGSKISIVGWILWKAFKPIASLDHAGKIE
ncbi:hypothetical protein Tco_1530803 [Tanacetum coccineum]